MITCENEVEVFLNLRNHKILLEPIEAEKPDYVQRIISFFDEYRLFIAYIFSEDHIYQILMSKEERHVLLSLVIVIVNIFERNIEELKRLEGVDFGATRQILRVNLGLVEFFNKIIEKRI